MKTQGLEMYLLLLGHVESDGGIGECCDRPTQPRRYPRGEREDWVPVCVDEIDARRACQKERIFIDLVTSDRKLKASREGSKSRIYGT